MPDYDFHQLSPLDLERFARDLLQQEWSLRLESFKGGRDKGIDLRYASGPEKLLIVQVKHYVRTGIAEATRAISAAYGRESAVAARRVRFPYSVF